MTRPLTTALSAEGVPVAVLALLEPDVDVDAARLLLGEGQVCGHGSSRPSDIGYSRQCQVNVCLEPSV